MKDLLKRMWCVLNGGHYFWNELAWDGRKCVKCPYKSHGWAIGK